MNIVLLGAPGTGKGTQAEYISKIYNIPSISTGAIIRNAIKIGAELGKKAESYIKHGDLAPDDVVIGIIKERISRDDCAAGFILDGFPRTIAQAEALLDYDIQIDAVISLEIPTDEILFRLSGRRECPSCGETYHMKYKPPLEGEICEKCGAGLIIREDDAEETVLNRLEVYHRQSEPLVEFYRKMNILRPVDASAEIEETRSKVSEILKEL